MKTAFLHRIKKITPAGDLILLVEFENGTTKKFDCKSILHRDENFKRLKNPGYFENIRIDPGGYGISWDDDLDLSENELWLNGY